MTSAATMQWLADLQARFSEALRLPLDRSTGTLRAELERYPDPTIADLAAGPLTSSDSFGSTARERLAVYQRQYWFRLFGVLQQEFRLTARLLGLWTFNGYASRFLEQHPPRHYDIHHAADGFADFLIEQLVEAHCDVPREAIRQASRIDQVFRELVAAPAPSPLVFTREQATILPRAQLVAGANWQLVNESWPLMALRHELGSDYSERPVGLPARHPHVRHWLLFASTRGPTAVPVAAIQARLLEALRRQPVSHALAEVEQGADDAERTLLLAQTQTWLAESVQRGFWTALVVE